LAPYMGKVSVQKSISVFDVQELITDADKARVTLVARGRETIDMMAEFEDVIKDRKHPTPPSAKKAPARGTSKGTPDVSSQVEPDLTEDSDLDEC